MRAAGCRDLSDCVGFGEGEERRTLRSCLDPAPPDARGYTGTRAGRPRHERTENHGLETRATARGDVVGGADVRREHGRDARATTELLFTCQRTTLFRFTDEAGVAYGSRILLSSKK